MLSQPKGLQFTSLSVRILHIFPTADDKKRLIIVEVPFQKDKVTLPEGKNFTILIYIAKKLQMNVASVGFDSKMFELRLFQRGLKLALKVSQRRKKCEQSSTSSLQNKLQKTISYSTRLQKTGYSIPG